MIGSLGSVVFSVSEGQVKTFRDLAFSHGVSYQEHKILNKNTLLEFTGRNKSTCNLTMMLDVNTGNQPLKDISELKDLMDNHEACLFVLDGQPVGSGDWVIEGLNVNAERIDNFGGIVRAKVEIKLCEYEGEVI